MTEEKEEILSEEEDLGVEDPTRSQIYEVGFLLVPSLSEDQLKVNFEGLRGALEHHGGTIISAESPHMRNLAYAMTKTVDSQKQIFKNAFFSWIKFEISAEKIGGLKELLRSNKNIIRSLLMRTVRENTYFYSRPSIPEEMTAASRPAVVNIEKRNKAPETLDLLKEEEIDKSIEELVTE
ncbi:MAG: hypothetical protein A3B14_01870 [Candidatus Zambryskibacteria bacterium RIFCSPLOWO2_01_FULL_45_21]|uniref:Small ribosomal subunit protein bS6 n=1 Tax=Candidatus Zambryskibacteria bacterium RIFCSPLOWO2_01_FULL_45_21 TaxID=1802761 RepID=A0A1G2U4D8_9BACT|nr:MAG: hypothetical protein A3B14_01870 [Candidatus Zambryskibacteria bacterium RIFCSPLOWO2_01_FULL_45_21]